MDSDIQKDRESLKIPETIDQTVFFELKVIYGAAFCLYVLAGILIIVA